MTAVLDVATRFLNVAGGRPFPDEPLGYSLMPAPRKSARGRERDALILCLGLRGRDEVLPEQYDALLDLAASIFFGSPGSVTSALRQALMAVNQKMLDDNLSRGAGQIQGGCWQRRCATPTSTRCRAGRACCWWRAPPATSASPMRPRARWG